MSNNGFTVAVFGNEFQAAKGIYTHRVLDRLKAEGIRVMIEGHFARFLSNTLGFDTTALPTFSGSGAFSADLALSMGGDGTFLKTAACIRDKHIPILGINTGRLGFLAEISPDAIDEALTAVLSHRFIVEKRSLIAVEADTPLSTYPYALNEVAILKADNSALINVRTEINGSQLANYVADGLIVCTPTGSTGYSLSVSGPIISPDSQSFCLSAVAPHSLNVRPVVVNDSAEIRLRVKSRTEKFLLSIDGRSEVLPAGTLVTLRRAPYTIDVIKIKHQHFFDTLREKMNWGSDQR